MNEEVEFALRKQRLQYRSANLRDQLVGYAADLTPVLRVGDAAVDGVRWVKRHPEAIAAASIALVVARPRAAFRWARRGVAAWQAWRNLRDWL